MYKFILLSVFLAFGLVGCSDDDDNAATVNSNSTFTAKDFFPLTGNQTLTYQVSGSRIYSETEYGRTVSHEESGSYEYQGYIGNSTSLYGKTIFPTYYIDPDTKERKKTYSDADYDFRLAGFGYLNNALIAVAEDAPNNPQTFLPESFSVGSSWTVDPKAENNDFYTLSCKEFFSSFTNKQGRTFSNVVVITGQYSRIEHASTDKVSGTAYFAKGIGIVEINANHDHNYNDGSYKFSSYKHCEASLK